MIWGRGREEELKHRSPEEVIEEERKVWIRSAPADLYYSRDAQVPGLMRATERGLAQQARAMEVLVEAASRERSKHAVEEPPRARVLPHHHGEEGSSSEEEEEAEASNHRVESLDWLEFRAKAANRAHAEVWQNVEGELNDGPACRCSKKARESGIRWEDARLLISLRETLKEMFSAISIFANHFCQAISVLSAV